MLLFFFGCKGKKKNFIRQIFFDFQKNILKYAEIDGCGRIIFCKNGNGKREDDEKTHKKPLLGILCVCVLYFNKLLPALFPPA